MTTKEQIAQCVQDARAVFEKSIQKGMLWGGDQELMDKFDFLGKGNFSDVYEHKETGIAVKFCGFHGELDAYPVYVELCRKHKDNPHAPNIHYFSSTPTHYFCVTDKYYECSKKLYDYVYDVLDDLRCSTRQPSNDLEELLIDLLKSGESMDLYHENIMQTLDGTPVITDPYSFC